MTTTDPSTESAVGATVAATSVAAAWSRRADHYLRFYRRHGEARRPAWRSALAAWLDAGAEPLRVLDVGTGTGFLATTLAGLGHDVVGIDLADRMLGHARAEAARHEVAPSFVRGAADRVDTLPELDGGVDVVTSRFVLWTLPDPLAALRAWHAVLRPGGLLVLADGLWRPRRPDPSGRVGTPGLRGRVRLVRDRYVLGRRAPFWRGLEPATARALLLDAGFRAPRRREDELAAHAWPAAEDFFVLTARRDTC